MGLGDAALLLDILPEEEYSSMNVYRADEWSKFEIELLCCKREQKWTIIVYLLHVTTKGTLNKTVRIFDTSLKVWVQFLVVEYRWFKLSTP